MFFNLGYSFERKTQQTKHNASFLCVVDWTQIGTFTFTTYGRGTTSPSWRSLRAYMLEAELSTILGKDLI